MLINEEGKADEFKQRTNEGNVVNANHAEIDNKNNKMGTAHRQGRAVFVRGRSVCYRYGKRSHTSNEC